MRKETMLSVFIAIIGAVVGAGATWGFDYVSSIFTDDPLKPIVENISDLNANMKKDNENIAILINELKNLSTDNPKILNLSININDQLRSIQNNASSLIEETSVLVQAAKSISDSASTYVSNPIADLFLVRGKATSLCGRENTFAVQEEYLNKNSIRATLKNNTNYMKVGEEWKFSTNNGKKGLVSYLGKTNNIHEFRVICDCEKKL